MEKKLKSDSPSNAADCSRIFRVRANFDLVIIARSEDDARNQIKNGMGEIDADPVEVSASEIKRLGDLPSGWDGKCLPWGKQPLGMDRNIEDILSENGQGLRPVTPERSQS